MPKIFNLRCWEDELGSAFIMSIRLLLKLKVYSETSSIRFLMAPKQGIFRMNQMSQLLGAFSGSKEKNA